MIDPLPDDELFSSISLAAARTNQKMKIWQNLLQIDVKQKGAIGRKKCECSSITISNRNYLFGRDVVDRLFS
jgi:hypothetical protein